MTGTIIFRIEIKREFGGFAACSNFLTKMVNHKGLCIEELRGIQSFYHNDIKFLDNKKIAEIANNTATHFREITKPDKLAEGIDGYRVVYCMIIGETEIDDVVEMQYYYLIKKYYSNLCLTSIIKGAQDFYHKVSHYFMEISRKDDLFYNSLFYNSEKLIRLQKENIKKTTAFVPLQYVEANMIKELQTKTRDIFEEEEFIGYITNKDKTDKAQCSIYLRGCLERLIKCSNIVKLIDVKELVESLLNGNILSFVLFSYSFYDCMKNCIGNEGSFTMKEVRAFYRQIRECAVCCQQLLENVILHSFSRTGTLSIRFHRKKTPYLNRYGDIKEGIPYLEILITDYAGLNKSGNLAQNFVNNIKDSVYKDNFELLQPIDFLSISSQIGERETKIKGAFEKYYSCSENIGRHMGIRIFKNIIEQNKGIFSFYSHSSHVIGKGESWRLRENVIQNRYAQCIPGTSYSILFPLEQRREIPVRAQVSIDENLELQENLCHYREDYDCIDKVLSFENVFFKEQIQKEKSIGKLAGQLIEDLAVDEKRHQVIYVSAEVYPDEFAEYLCKALLISGYKRKIADYVFYNCTKEFVSIFQQSINVYFKLGTMAYVFQDKSFTIALFTKDPVEETIIIPESLNKTRRANKLSGFAGGTISEKEWLGNEESYVEARSVDELLLPPYDILHEVEIDGNFKTIFEHYTLQVLERDIQEEAFGCKISHTHMRLGSTIHIDSFYEAELLFSNRLFISRFAYLLVQGIEKSEAFMEAGSITLYSYALYSELLVFETMSILKKLHPDKLFDYAILERESEHRAFSHVDRIRYSKYFSSVEERKNHFCSSKVICIVPVNSTLKTHEKLIDLLCKDNPGFAPENIIINYAIVLVGSKRENMYWTIDEKNRTFSDIKLEISPTPHYFIAVKVTYQEALGCKMCFPDNPLNEVPLIEVNASSTIPEQSFGLYQNINGGDKITYEQICKEEALLSVLKSSLIYAHIERGENHFSLYFQTDRLFIENKEDIEGWLKNVCEKIEISDGEYHILVCPAHFSNAGFLECINKTIFHEAALIMRVDVDKEYRCNVETKYSFIGQFLEILSRQREQKTIIRLYFIDDVIVTGRTFQRMKSLVSSVMKIYTNQYKNLDIYIFDKIFILLDRNSPQTRMQYVECAKKGELRIEQQRDIFFAYRSLRISSMRNHGDSCVVCQLANQAEMLYQTSATQFMAEHWDEESIDFAVKRLMDKQEEKSLDSEKKRSKRNKEQQTDRAFRRMLCMHVSALALNETKHGNRTENAIKCILELLLEDYNGRKQKSQQEAFEYFLSYLKVISRPFLAFSKPVREAIFDILLILSEYLLNEGEYSKWKDLSKGDKSYLAHKKSLFEMLKERILDDIIDDVQKKDLLLVVMKQIMELRSNYYIRPENIRRLSSFIKRFDIEIQKDIYRRYLYLVKKLLGVNSDTSKSAWLNHILCQKEVQEDQMGLPKEVFTILVLENTRAYYDGISRLNEVDGIMDGILSNEIKKFQYRDFRRILKDYLWMDEENLNSSGSQALMSSIRLLQLAKEFKGHDKGRENKKIIEQCRKIVELFGNILKADSVKLIMELPLECDLWEEDIKSRFNQSLQKDEGKKFRFEIDEKKEYLIIADSAHGNKSNRLPLVNAKKLNELKGTRMYDTKGFIIDENAKLLIWEIGDNKPHSIILYVEFHELNYFENLQLIRNVMTLRYFFCEHIFNRRTSNYLYELMVAKKERLVYNTDKNESHTTSEHRQSYYSDVQSGQYEKEVYISYVLKLLADLQVSCCYRHSLHQDYYCRRQKIGEQRWSETPISFQGTTLFRIAKDPLDKFIDLKVCTDQMIFEDDKLLQKTDSMIGYKHSSSVMTPFLLVFSLITNALPEDRAVREAKQGTTEKCIYLTKTLEGNLRITNKCCNKTEGEKGVEQILDEMVYPPGQEQGISMWSMSRFIKAIISVLANNSLLQLKKELSSASAEDRYTILEKEKGRIEELLSEKFQIKLNRKEVKNIKYFYIELPILSDKYNDYKELFTGQWDE